MTGLWNRVGIYRSLGALLLIGALAGGVAVAADGPTEQPAKATNASNSEPLDVANLERQDAERADAERAARNDAQRKANEAAVAAAEQAKKSPSASASASAKSATGGGKPGAGVPPAPSSCQVYSGHRQTGCTLTLAAGFDLQQFACLEKLFTKESGWNPTAKNKSSGAYGIPQALPGSKMATIAGDWQTNAATQIRWGLSYIKSRYTTPCKAWNHSQANNWY